MRPIFIAIVAVLSFLSLFVIIPPPEPAEAVNSTCFEPSQDCVGVITAEIAKAHKSVLVQAYEFTNPTIARALIAAHQARPGMEMLVVLDAGVNRASNTSQAGALAAAGITVLLDGKHAIAHNKVMVFDHHVVVTGSMNDSVAAATRNAENIIVVRSDGIASVYEANVREHAGHSVPFVSAGSG